MTGNTFLILRFSYVEFKFLKQASQGGAKYEVYTIIFSGSNCAPKV